MARAARTNLTNPCMMCNGTGTSGFGDDCAKCNGTGSTPTAVTREGTGVRPAPERTFGSPTGSSGASATPAQLRYLSSLVADVERTGTEDLVSLARVMREFVEKGDELTKTVASELIDASLAALRTHRTTDRQATKAATHAKATEGLLADRFYTDGEAVMLVVRSASSGGLYGKRRDPDTGRYEYEPGWAARALQDGWHLMSVEEAETISRRQKRCCICWRKLTAKASVARGIGPICASKVGG